jgi:putative membrane protein
MIDLPIRPAPGEQMVKRLIIVWAATAVAFALTAALVPSVEIEGGALSLIGLAALFGLVNAIIGTVLRLLAIPLMVITFGLFALAINAVLLAITAGLSDVLDVGGVFSTVVAAVVLSVISAVLGWAGGRLLEDSPTPEGSVA